MARRKSGLLFYFSGSNNTHYGGGGREERGGTDMTSILKIVFRNAFNFKRYSRRRNILIYKQVSVFNRHTALLSV